MRHSSARLSGLWSVILSLFRRGIWTSLILLLSISAAPAADAPLLRIGYSNQDSPFFIMGNGSAIPPMPGIAVEIAAAAARECNVAVDSARYPGGRLLAHLADNTIDAVLMLSFSPERLAIAVYPMAGDAADPAFQLATLSYAFYVRKGSDVSWDGNAMSGLKEPVGANFGWSIVDDLKKRGLAVETAQETGNNFNKLLRGRIDAFAIQTSIGDAYVERHKLAGKVAALEPPISSKPYYLVFSHGWHEAYPEAASCLWREIARIRDKDMQALSSRYHDSM
jgi:polar amino acid transport system substrate-binding protein